MNLIEHFIDGKIFPGSSKRRGKVFNPATGEQTAEIKLGTTEDVNKAVQSAKKAYNMSILLHFRERELCLNSKK